MTQRKSLTAFLAQQRASITIKIVSRQRRQLLGVWHGCLGAIREGYPCEYLPHATTAVRRRAPVTLVRTLSYGPTGITSSECSVVDQRLERSAPSDEGLGTLLFRGDRGLRRM